MTDIPSVSASKGNPAVRPFRLYLKALDEKRRPPRGADAVVHLDDQAGAGFRLHHNFRQLWPLPLGNEGEVQAFLLLALGVWAADKLVPRSLQPDAWTRDLLLEIPTTPNWAGLAPRLALLLKFLTGDTWTIQPRESLVDLKFSGNWTHPWQPTAVALFSGGLDSLTGAIDLLEQGHRLVLVSHYDYGQLASTQQVLAAALSKHYGPDRVHHVAMRVQLEGPELTLRSRSLLYLALGLTAVAAFPGDLPLFIPENGWISLNPPLTLNRLGTYSTRTTHPHFLGELVALWNHVGLAQELENPYQGLTKGEMLAQCRNLSLLEQLAPLSISCARPVVGRWQGEPVGACGYCYPCLVRRAALHRLGRDRGEDYRVDVLADSNVIRHRVKGRHLRALCLALKTWEENPQEMFSRLWLGAEPQEISRRAAAAQRLLDAGFTEHAEWIKDQGGSGIREFLGERGEAG